VKLELGQETKLDAEYTDPQHLDSCSETLGRAAYDEVVRLKLTNALGGRWVKHMHGRLKKPYADVQRW
jgi:hypothetical protein